MPEPKQYLKKIKLPSNDIKWIRDDEAVHTDEIGSYLDDYLPLTGGDITGDVNITGDVSITGNLSATNISLGDISEKTTTISNVLTKDEQDSNKLKYHSTEDFLEEIGGIGVVSVENNVLTYSLGKYKENG